MLLIPTCIDWTSRGQRIYQFPTFDTPLGIINQFRNRIIMMCQIHSILSVWNPLGAAAEVINKMPLNEWTGRWKRLNCNYIDEAQSSSDQWPSESINFTCNYWYPLLRGEKKNTITIRGRFLIPRMSANYCSRTRIR